MRDCETKENSLNLVLKPELIEKASHSSTISDNLIHLLPLNP